MNGDSPTIPIWLRARWQLPDGSIVVRTVRRDVPGDSGDEASVASAVERAVMAVETDGAVFREGQATLVELIATETG